MPPGPVTGPSVWYGRDLAAREHDWIYRLSPAELAEIDAAVHIFKASGRSLAAISPEDFPLPAFGGALRRLGAELLEGRGFFMLRGLPGRRLHARGAGDRLHGDRLVLRPARARRTRRATCSAT